MSEPLYKAYLEGRLLLRADGAWFHDGALFTNEKLIALFNRSLTWIESEGRYALRIGLGEASFSYEDTVYFVLAIEESPELRVELSDGTSEPLEAGSLSSGKESQIYCRVKGPHRARLSRAAHQFLLARASGPAQVRLGGKLFEIRSQE